MKLTKNTQTLFEEEQGKESTKIYQSKRSYKDKILGLYIENIRLLELVAELKEELEQQRMWNFIAVQEEADLKKLRTVMRRSNGRSVL